MKYTVRFTSALLGFLLGSSAYLASRPMSFRTSFRHEHEKLKHHVDALENGPVGTISLGKPQAAPTEDTKYLISHGEAAVPLLSEALKWNDKPNSVRYAAYCLRRMRSDRGRAVAANVYAKLAAKGVITIEEVWALGELSLYLKELDNELEH